MGKMIITCKGCSSIYEFTSQKAIMRVKEVFNCKVCGELLYKCNEAKDWSDKLIEKHENHQPKSDFDGFSNEPFTGKA
jgi:hypothetical protein